jgi:hypothetical protein
MNLELYQTKEQNMHDLLPEGDDLRKAVKWMSAHIQENPDQPLNKFVQEAIFRFNLSPKDAEFLMRFYRKDQ